jgi:hydrogenase expression/formation protein HypC
MTVISCDGDVAVCERRGEHHRVSVLLLGVQEAGTHLLVHLGNAVRVLDPVEAAQIDDALSGLAAAVNGESFDHMFADLVGRDPQLPDHLKR